MRVLLRRAYVRFEHSDWPLFRWYMYDGWDGIHHMYQDESEEGIGPEAFIVE